MAIPGMALIANAAEPVLQKKAYPVGIRVNKLPGITPSGLTPSKTPSMTRTVSKTPSYTTSYPE